MKIVNGYKVYTKLELRRIIKKHNDWLMDKKDNQGNKVGECANLSYANLSYANLSYANLSEAILSEANLSYAILRNANLRNANLSYAILRNANLRNANLSYANLSEAILSEANLSYAILSEANLSEANLSEANLSEAILSHAILRNANLRNANLRNANLSYANLDKTYLDEKEQCRKGIILKEKLIGYKKLKNGVIATLEIPKGAIVFSINNFKCRTNRCKCIDLSDNTEIGYSRYCNEFTYAIGKENEIENFDLMYNAECSSGIHFFINKQEAIEYN